MKMVGVALLAVVVVLVVALAVYWVASALRPRDGSIKSARSLVREHNKLMIKAGRASRRGDSGLANIYSESASELLGLADRITGRMK